jgi:hypothetical protein
MPESISIRTDDDPDSQALKTGLGLIFWPKPTLIVLGWLGVLFLGWPSKLVIFATLIWLGAHLMFRPSKFGVEIGIALDAVRQFFAWTTEQLGKHIAPIFAKLNAAHRGKRSAPAPEPMAFAAASRSADASVAAAVTAPRPPRAPRAPRAPINWLGVLRRWWWVAPVALLALIAFRFVDWATGFLNEPSAREIVAEVEAEEANAERRTAEAEAERNERTIVRIEEAAARRFQINEQTETARAAIQTTPDDDIRGRLHDAYVDRVRDQSARDRADALQDYHSSVDP